MWLDPHQSTGSRINYDFNWLWCRGAPLRVMWPRPPDVPTGLQPPSHHPPLQDQSGPVRTRQDQAGWVGLGSITRLINVRKVSRQCVSTHTPQNLNKLPKRISQWRVGQTFVFQCESLHLSKPASVIYGSRRLGFSDPCLERFNPRSSHQ